MKVLVLHGYTQSGPFFERKLSRLQSYLQQVFPTLSFVFPTAHLKLKPSEITDRNSGDIEDVSGDSDLSPSDEFRNADGNHEIENYAWFKVHDTKNPQDGLQQSIAQIAHILNSEGPFDGMMGFSQGSSLVGLAASMLENPAVRKEAFIRHLQDYPGSMKFPAAFENLDHPPLKFCVSYATYMGIGPTYAAFYSNPLIETPYLHFFGKYDPVLSEEMKLAVEAACIGGRNRQKVIHPGAHIVPVAVEYMEKVASFIANSMITYDLKRIPDQSQLCVDTRTHFQATSLKQRSAHLESSFQQQNLSISDQMEGQQISGTSGSMTPSQSTSRTSTSVMSSSVSKSSSDSSIHSPLMSEQKTIINITESHNGGASAASVYRSYFRKSRQVRVFATRILKTPPRSHSHRQK